MMNKSSIILRPLRKPGRNLKNRFMLELELEGFYTGMHQRYSAAITMYIEAYFKALQTYDDKHRTAKQMTRYKKMVVQKDGGTSGKCAASSPDESRRPELQGTVLQVDRKSVV